MIKIHISQRCFKNNIIRLEILDFTELCTTQQYINYFVIELESHFSLDLRLN